MAPSLMAHAIRMDAPIAVSRQPRTKTTRVINRRTQREVRRALKALLSVSAAIAELAASTATTLLATVTDCRSRHEDTPPPPLNSAEYAHDVATTPRLLTARTREIGQGDPLRDPHLLELLPAHAPMSWVRENQGLIGWGVAARYDAAGPDRFRAADDWWRQLYSTLDIDDPLALAGTGPVAFASMAFADDPGDSVIVLPQVIIGERDGVRWITTVGEAETRHRPHPPQGPGIVRYSDGELSAANYREVVAEAIRSMRMPDSINKVVLAHDLIASTSQPLDPRFLLRNLAERYPSCWAFAVGGLVGATPELLVERTGNQVRSQVLAGTSWPRDGLDADQVAKELLASVKDRDEHAYAIDSLAASLRPFVGDLTVPDEPAILKLRNVVHLASDVSGQLVDGNEDSALMIAAALHPTAAVGGTPTPDAVTLIRKLENMDRGRYAGPVGWLDAAGNGEFGIALRCAEIHSSTSEPGQARLFAGCGIVAESQPDLEVAEAEAKLLPMREALES